MSHNELKDPYSSLVFQRSLLHHLCAACLPGWKSLNISPLYAQATLHLSPPQLPCSVLTPRCYWCPHPLHPLAVAATAPCVHTQCREAELSTVPGEQPALCAQPAPLHIKLFSRKAWGAGRTYGSEQAGQLAAGKGHCWGICSFDVLPCFVGPKHSSTTSVLQKPSTAGMCGGTHSCGELHPGQDGISRTPIHAIHVLLLPKCLLLVPGPCTLGVPTTLSTAPVIFLEILQTSRHQQEPRVLPTATQPVP